MHVLTPDGTRLLSGFAALRWLAWRLPLLWPLAPFLYLPGMATLGQRLYLWVARNRLRLVPCHGGVCTVQHSLNGEPKATPHAEVLANTEQQ